MRHVLIAAFVVFVVALVGMFVWFSSVKQRYEAEVAALRQANREPVTVEFAVSVPPTTPEDQLVYVTGSGPALGAWDPAGLALEPGDDGRHYGSAEVLRGIEYEYKITRGTWSTVERGPAGEEIDNRLLRADEPMTVDVEVTSWVDGGKSIPGRITITGELRLHKNVHSDILANERTLAVWLPPGYDDEADRRYPVLYVQDGQNLFDESASFAGVEWQMDETAQRLIEQGAIQPIIIVGLYNTPDRDAEYTPSAAGDALGTPARGDDYVRALVEQFKPFIDQRYQTRTGPEHTAIAGAGLGGLIALHAAATAPQTFGSAATLSPWLRLGASGDDAGFDLARHWQQQPPDHLADLRLWIDMGDSPGSIYPGPTPLEDADALVAALDSAGLAREDDYRYERIPGGTHDEAAWQQRLDRVLMFLFAEE